MALGRRGIRSALSMFLELSFLLWLSFFFLKFSSFLLDLIYRACSSCKEKKCFLHYDTIITGRLSLCMFIQSCIVQYIQSS